MCITSLSDLAKVIPITMAAFISVENKEHVFTLKEFVELVQTAALSGMTKKVVHFTVGALERSS